VLAIADAAALAAPHFFAAMTLILKLRRKSKHSHASQGEKL
jgi:hypothetical protein